MVQNTHPVSTFSGGPVGGTKRTTACYEASRNSSPLIGSMLLRRLPVNPSYI